MYFYDLAIHDASHETLGIIIINKYNKYDNNNKIRAHARPARAPAASPPAAPQPTAPPPAARRPTARRPTARRPTARRVWCC